MKIGREIKLQLAINKILFASFTVREMFYPKNCRNVVCSGKF